MSKNSNNSNNQPMLFDKTNYYLMFAGLAVLILGFILMAGGKSSDPANTFNEAEIYSFRRITLAPILVIIGFVIEIFAIMRKPKATSK